MNNNPPYARSIRGPGGVLALPEGGGELNNTPPYARSIRISARLWRRPQKGITYWNYSTNDARCAPRMLACSLNAFKSCPMLRVLRVSLV